MDPVDDGGSGSNAPPPDEDHMGENLICGICQVCVYRWCSLYCTPHLQLSESLFALQEVFHDCVRSVCQLCVTACGQCPQHLELCAPVGV